MDNGQQKAQIDRGKQTKRIQNHVAILSNPN